MLSDLTAKQGRASVRGDVPRLEAAGLKHRLQPSMFTEHGRRHIGLSS